MEIILTMEKFGFTLTPCHIPFCARKDQAKADISNKYIGFGIEGTSTYRYGVDAVKQNIPLNSENYSYSDIVYVSINGGKNFNEYNFIKTRELAIKALNSGATIVCDNDNQRNKHYNSFGEGRFYKDLIDIYEDNLNEDTNELFSMFKLNYCLYFKNE